MNVPATARALRARLRWSQRELAAAAGIPHSTLARIEAGRCDPKLSTMIRLAGAVGAEIVVVDRKQRPIEPDDDKERLRDRAGRHFPAHLPAGKTPDYFEGLAPGWWGWHRIAFPPCDDKRKPEHTFWKRPRACNWAEWGDVT